MSDKKKLVVIDDEAEFCLMMKEVLEATGQFEVTTTTDPMTAENLIRQVTPHVILVDIVMPKRKGTDVIAAIKKDEALKRTPIIVISGKGEMVYHHKKNEFKWTPNNPMVKERGTLPDAKSAEALAQAYGVNDFIAKPFTHQMLMEVLNDVIAKAQKKKAEDEKPADEI